MSDRIYYSEEAKHRARRERAATSIVFLLLGASIGATIAMLFAPYEGEESREMVSSALEEGYKRGREATEKTIQQALNEYPDIRERVDGFMSRVKNLS